LSGWPLHELLGTPHDGDYLESPRGIEKSLHYGFSIPPKNRSIINHFSTVSTSGFQLSWTSFVENRVIFNGFFSPRHLLVLTRCHALWRPGGLSPRRMDDTSSHGVASSSPSALSALVTWGASSHHKNSPKYLTRKTPYHIYSFELTISWFVQPLLLFYQPHMDI
jgi:hypothetical protein